MGIIEESFRIFLLFILIYLCDIFLLIEVGLLVLCILYVGFDSFIYKGLNIVGGVVFLLIILNFLVGVGVIIFFIVIGYVFINLVLLYSFNWCCFIEIFIFFVIVLFLIFYKLI